MANVAFSASLPGQNELPSDDGEPMETGFHDAQDALLKDTLLDAWRNRRDFFVAGNMFVYFSERQVRNNDFRGPDVFVVLDVDGRGRKSWVAWEEGGRLPDVVIEVTSESTAHLDRGEKMQIYAQIWRTPAYFVFDPETEQLEGFTLDSARTARRRRTRRPSRGAPRPEARPPPHPLPQLRPTLRALAGPRRHPPRRPRKSAPMLPNGASRSSSASSKSGAEFGGARGTGRASR
jgi:Uma2 family endonuclease